MQALRETEVQFHTFLTLTINGGVWTPQYDGQ